MTRPIRLTCISDLHGFTPELPGGDILILAGDLTKSDQEHQYFEVFDWLDRQEYKEKILVAGNHDMLMEKQKYQGPAGREFHYLCDSGIEVFGMKIWGSPRSLAFPGINSKCIAFTGSETDLKNQYDLVPRDTDIMISHGPAFGVLDKTARGENAGSYALLEALDRVKPKVLIAGHIHENYGTLIYKHCGPNTKCINPSYVNERYKPINQPISINI